MNPLYDRIGATYRASRAADPRIVEIIEALLDLPAGSVVGDIGAGSGNYTNALADRGYRMVAVEPSAVMRRQAAAHDKVEWREGVAENLPLDTGSLAGAICTLACHHFADLGKAARELARVCGDGPLVFLTMDPRLAVGTWFERYFPEIWARDFALFPPQRDFVAAMAQASGRAGEAVAFPLPSDLADSFMHAPWGRPEAYLDEVFRANTSGFARADQKVVERRLRALREDLAAGRWDCAFGRLRTQATCEMGFYFAVFR